jgi:hypothetical protein
MLIVALGFGLWVIPVRADQGWEGDSLSINWENDATRDSDRHYTQGGRVLYLSSDDAAPEWMRSFSKWIPTWGFKEEGLKFGVELGQEIYTPEDLDATEVVKDDQPYAGWLYASAILQRRGPAAGGLPVIETLRLDIGVVGPASLAENAQKIWHSRDPKGWHNQLGNEPGLNLRYDRSYLFRWEKWEKWQIDGVPSLDGALGNVDIHIGTTAMLRAGYNIPNRFEVPRGRTRKGFSVYAFGTAGGRLIARNLFLDGNTWKSSHSVEKDPLVGNFSAGVTLVLGLVELSASNHFLTREFVTQKNSDSYGSATVTFKF